MKNCRNQYFAVTLVSLSIKHSLPKGHEMTERQLSYTKSPLRLKTKQRPLFETDVKIT
jgi:hypothetical protein